MGDTIRALSEAVDKHGLAATVAIVAIAILIVFLIFHISMLKKWSTSNEAVAKSNGERMDKADQRHDGLLVAYMNQQKDMLKVNQSQDEKLGKLHQLDVLVTAATDAALRVEEQAEVNAKQTELMKATADSVKALNEALGSDPQKICQLKQLVMSELPDITGKELRRVLAYFLRKAEEEDKSAAKHQKKGHETAT